MEHMYNYDAFISYRHLPLDEAVATRVQELLERYRPPKGVCGSKHTRIERIFRDKTELPTSGDLDQALRNALLSSRFLIVILSEQTKHSKWCMEEIRQFKEAHGGKISHILPVLVSGEPSDSIPELLRFETQTDAAGNPILAEVEPLCCDVRADSVSGAQKKLKTEFLRLAAPLLDCGFDDLYQRHKKRAKQQRIVSVCAAAAVSLALGATAYSSWRSYQAYQKNLLDTYIQQGSVSLAQDVQQSLTYFTKALSMEPSSQAAETATLMLLQQNNWLSNTAQVPRESVSPPAMPQYGNLLNAAEDGSCYSYYDGSTVTLYRPESESLWQIPVPTKVNPACAADSVVEGRPYAMAISDSRAIIRNSGYLYLYDLEPNGKSSLFSEFDLALVFKDETSKGNLDLWNETWADPDGKLAVLYNGASAAVINVANTKNPCLNAVHTVYGYELSSVAFSSDGSYYALVYGNDFGIDLYDPGGYTEVYDEYGNLCMATPVDATMAPEEAAFEPEGNRLLLWGSGILQVWDIATGTPAAAPIKLDQIESAGWTEDGLISVSDGSDTLDIYTPMQFIPCQPAPADTEAAAEPDVYQQEISLSDGFLLKHNYSKIWLEDAGGNPVGEEIPAAINKMYAQTDSNTAYFWYDNTDTLIRVTIKDDRSGLDADSLDALGLNIVDLKAVPSGLVAFTGNDSMLFYPHGSTSPLHTMTFGRSGNMDGSAGVESGLLAIVLKSTQYYTSDSHNFEYQYTLELWDLNTGICVARPVTDSAYRISNLSLTDDGWLTYQIREDSHHYLVNLPDADASTVQNLCSIPCLTILPENSIALQTPVIPAFSGNWKESITAEFSASVYAEAETPVNAYLHELNSILKTKGADPWLDRYQQIWATLEDAPLPLDDMCDLFRDYVRTARNYDLMDQLEPGFACMTKAFAADGGEDWISLYGFTIQTTQYMLQTDAYDDIMIDYWLDLANQMEARLDPESEDWFLDFAAIYENRLYAALLLGYESDAFYAAVDEVYHDSLGTILVESNLDKLYYMVIGKPEKAAKSFSLYLDQIQSLYAYDPETCVSETEQAIMFLLWDLNLFEQRGIISEADVSQLIDALPVTVGIRLAQVTPENLQAGLYLDDVVTAVNETRVFNQYHIQDLAKEYPTASLTAKRGNQSFTTETLNNWVISGDFYAQ